jgi:hypothetical protein
MSDEFAMSVNYPLCLDNFRCVPLHGASINHRFLKIPNQYPKAFRTATTMRYLPFRFMQSRSMS